MNDESKRPRPIDPATGNPLPMLDQPGYYPGFETLTQTAFWDAATRETIMKRVEDIPPIRFFNEEDARLMECVLGHVLPQEDRAPWRRIPLINHLDDRLFNNRIDGYRYEDMPTDPDAYSIAIQAFHTMAREVHGKDFMDCTYTQQEALLLSLHDHKPAGAHLLWKKMSLKRFWVMLVHDAATAYYAHPWSWDEIGFGGPAYPRGYMRLEHGEPEPWEVEEQRYEWIAPPGCLSDKKA